MLIKFSCEIWYVCVSATICFNILHLCILWMYTNGLNYNFISEVKLNDRFTFISSNLINFRIFYSDGTIIWTQTSRKSSGQPPKTSAYSSCMKLTAIDGQRSLSTYRGALTIISRIITIQPWNGRLSRGQDSKEWSWYTVKSVWSNRMSR